MCRASHAAAARSQSQRLFVDGAAVCGVAAAAASVEDRRLGGAPRPVAGVVARSLPSGDVSRRRRRGRSLPGRAGRQRHAAAVAGAGLDDVATGTDQSRSCSDVVDDQDSSRHQVLPLPYVWTGAVLSNFLIQLAFHNVAFVVLIEFLCLAPPHSFDEGFMFLGYPVGTFVRSFVRSDIVTTLSHERLEQFW